MFCYIFRYYSNVPLERWKHHFIPQCCSIIRDFVSVRRSFLLCSSTKLSIGTFLLVASIPESTKTYRLMSPMVYQWRVTTKFNVFIFENFISGCRVGLRYISSIVICLCSDSEGIFVQMENVK